MSLSPNMRALYRIRSILKDTTLPLIDRERRINQVLDQALDVTDDHAYALLSRMIDMNTQQAVVNEHNLKIQDWDISDYQITLIIYDATFDRHYDVTINLDIQIDPQ